MRVLMVTSGWPTPEKPETSIMVSEQVRFLRAEGVEVDVVAYNGAMRPANYLRARRLVQRTLSRGSFDLVHGQFGQTGLVVVPATIPLVMTFHGSDLLGVVGPRGRYTPRGRVLRAVSRWVARRADRVIVVGHLLAERLPAGVPYEVIPVGVDADVFHPGSKAEARAELGYPRGEKIVVFGGRPSVPVKRYSLALEVMKRLVSSQSARLVVMEGKTHAEVATTLRSADALLMTSKHEGAPAIIKEAIATGLPVVSVDVGDVRELIGGLDWCALCTDDPDDLAKELGRILSLPEASFSPSPALQERIQQQSLVRRLIDVYKEVIEAASQRAE